MKIRPSSSGYFSLPFSTLHSSEFTSSHKPDLKLLVRVSYEAATRTTTVAVSQTLTLFNNLPFGIACTDRRGTQHLLKSREELDLSRCQEDEVFKVEMPKMELFSVALRSAVEVDHASSPILVRRSATTITLFAQCLVKNATGLAFTLTDNDSFSSPNPVSLTEQRNILTPFFTAASEGVLRLLSDEQGGEVYIEPSEPFSLEAGAEPTPLSFAVADRGKKFARFDVVVRVEPWKLAAGTLLIVIEPRHRLLNLYGDLLVGDALLKKGSDMPLFWRGDDEHQMFQLAKPGQRVWSGCIDVNVKGTAALRLPCDESPFSVVQVEASARAPSFLREARAPPFLLSEKKLLLLPLPSRALAPNHHSRASSCP